MKRLTKRQKDIVSSANPRVEFTSQEIKSARRAARGHYWDERDFAEFVAVNSKGYKKHFDYCHHPNDPARCRRDKQCENDWPERRRLAKQWARR